MIKRLFVIVVLTGLAHAVNLISLKFLAKFSSPDTIAVVGELDSLLLLIITINTFGLQLSTSRELALNEDTWRKDYYLTQSARISMALILMLIGFTGFYITKNLLFFFTPILAYNADFALYGRGKPITGAFVSFIRVSVPSFVIIFCVMYAVKELPIYFVVATLVAHLIVGFIVSKVLGVKYFVEPKLNTIKVFLKNAPIGVANLSYFFIGLGILTITSLFYSELSTSIAYIALKLYFIFTGVRRIIIQSFYKELVSLKMAIKTDYLTLTAAVIFLSCFVFYPGVFLPLLFDEKIIYDKYVFIILGAMAFVSSVSSSSDARMLLRKKDTPYSINYITAGATTVVSSVLLFYLIGDTPISIMVSCLLGEVVLSVLNVFSLKEPNYYWDRIKLVLPVIIVLILSYLLYILLGSFLASGLLFLSITGLLVKNKLKKLDKQI